MKLTFLGFHVAVLVEIFSLMYQINYQCWTDIDDAKVISARQAQVKIQFRTFLKKNLFHAAVPVKIFPLIHQLATNV